MSDSDKIIDLFEKGHNIFISGPGGTGKTYNLNKIIKYLKNKKINFLTTAMTGAASLHVDGATTLHRGVGIGISKDLSDLDGVLKNKYFKRKVAPMLYNLDVLIVDEVSLLHRDLMDLVDSIFKNIKGNNEPFGGIQVILIGDFCQLKPVDKTGRIDIWAFQSKSWNDLDIKHVYLKEIKRQDDMLLINNLNKIRTGYCDDTIEKYFRDTEGHTFGNYKPVKLVATNNEVDQINANEFNKINGEEEHFDAILSGDENSILKLIKDCNAKRLLRLKRGCQVMILKNGDGYVNGSMGKYLGQSVATVFDYEEKKEKHVPALEVELVNGKNVLVPINEWKITKKMLGEYWCENDNEIKNGPYEIELASMKQFPVRLGFGITSHKAQGMSLDYLEIDFIKFFTEGQAYVALSRAKSYKGLKCINFRRGFVKINQDVFNFYMDLVNRGEI